MGRGRAKAKQQKVARDLKYNTHFTDLDALQRELGVTHPNGSGLPPDAAPDGATRGDSARAGGSDDPDDADEYEDWNGTEH
jgi:hypothetical protein